MYAPKVRNRFLRDLGLAFAFLGLTSCRMEPRSAAGPVPERQQTVGDAARTLYLAVSKAPPRSAEQRRLVLKMAEGATNGKELLMAMRAGMGVFPSAPGASDAIPEARVRSIVTAKMLKLGTLSQLLDYAAKYGVEAQDARPLVVRMCELGKTSSDPQVWRRIGATAARLNLGDLERLAQAQERQ
jgi:hypothetical protein